MTTAPTPLPGMPEPPGVRPRTDDYATWIDTVRPAFDIAARSGVSPSPVRNLAAGRSTTILRTTRDAILGIPKPKPGARPACNGFVDATGSRRRLQALCAVGFGLPYLSRRLGISIQGLGVVRRGVRANIRITAHQKIARLYDELWDQDPRDHGTPPETIAALHLHATRRGWPRPAALDDDLIDWAEGRVAA